MDAGRDSVPTQEVPGSLSTPPLSRETPQATGTRLAFFPDNFDNCRCPDCLLDRASEFL